MSPQRLTACSFDEAHRLLVGTTGLAGLAEVQRPAAVSALD
ncbi:hypothetical protein [Thermomicrobium sp. CFH 73360]|nr:hypothetical protein [Thermomicrobium sp. CFH 73360]